MRDAQPTVILFFADGDVGADPDERRAAEILADKLGLPGEGADTARLDVLLAEVVKGYAVRVESHYYLCGLAGYHKFWLARQAGPLDVRDDLREEACPAFRRWARLLKPPCEMDFVSLEESMRLWNAQPQPPRSSGLDL